MPRWILGLLGILIVALVIVGIYVFLALSRPAVAGPFLRTANPQILLGGGESLVTLHQDMSGLPVCTPQQRSADIVLVTDISGSMEGAAFEQARAAMEDFARVIDLNVNQVAIVYFSDDAELMQPLTANVNEIGRALNQSASSGGTSIEAGLRVALQELSSARRRASALPVIVLLSDGGTHDRAATISEVQQLKDAGVRIVTIALPGQDLDTQFMRELASLPGDAYQTPSTAQLATIYASLAEQMNQGRAFNARIQEALNLNQVQAIPDSLNPHGMLENGNPTWQIGVMTSLTPTFQYRVRTDQLGLVDVSMASGLGALVDCAGLNQSWILPAGPTLLVLPPLWCFLLPLLLIPLLLFGLFRRSRPAASVNLASPAAEPDIPSIQEIPAWLKRLADTQWQLSTESVPAQTSDEDLQNTLLIGIGPAGREVLSQVAQKLTSRYGKLPSKVRFLQIDAMLKGTAGDPPPLPLGLQPHQRVLLQANLQEVEKNLRDNPNNWKHWKWFEHTAPQYERALGRAALFYDLRDGEAGSELWQRLREHLQNFNSPRVRIVGTTFDDTASGMLADVARLVQIVAQGNLPTEFWLATAMGVDWSERLNDRRQRLNLFQQRSRTLATLRELERFETNVAAPFVYVSSTHRQAVLRETARGLVQTLYLFEPRSALVPSSPNTKPEMDVLPCMADALLALLHRETSNTVNEHTQARRAEASAKTNTEGMGMAQALGCYSFQLPGEPLTEAMAWRMTRDLLFDEQVGILPRERTLESGEYQALDESEWNVVTTDERASYRAEAERFIERHVNNYGLDSSAFTHALARRVLDLLNGENEAGTEPVLARRGGLPRAKAWLEAVRGFVTRRGERNPAQRITTLIQQLELWQEWLGSSLHDTCRVEWHNARERLGALRLQSGRNWLIDETLEWQVYHNQVRPVLNAPPAASQDSFIRAGRRFGWELAFTKNGAWQLRLIIPPPNWLWQEHSPIESFALSTGSDTRAGLERIYAIAVPFARRADKTEILIQRAEQYSPRDWVTKNALPRLAFDGLLASDLMNGVRDLSVLIVPSGMQTQNLETKLEHASSEAGSALTVHQAASAAPRASNFRVIRTSDPTTITLLQVMDWVPLLTTNVFGRDAWTNTPIDSAMYVWRQEQSAAQLEYAGRELYMQIRADVQLNQMDDKAPSAMVRGEMLSPRFVSWLGADERLVRLYGFAYLFQVMEESEEGLEIPGMGLIQGESYGGILEQLIEQPNEKLIKEREQTLGTLEKALQAAQQHVAKDLDLGVSAYLQQSIETMITPLLTGNDKRNQDLGRYLLGLIAEQT